MTEPLIRRAIPSDIPALSALKQQAFHETFVQGYGIPYPPADIAIFIDANYSVHAITAELADPAQATWVVEAPDCALIGYARVVPCKLPHPEADPSQGELSQLYLLRQAQGGGMGKALMQTALDHIAVHFPGPVWLGVWSGNDKAQRFYARLGFEKVGEYDFPVGSWTDHEYILRRPLTHIANP